MKTQSQHFCPCPRYFLLPGVFCGYRWSNESGSREEASCSRYCLHTKPGRLKLWWGPTTLSCLCCFSAYSLVASVQGPRSVGNSTWICRHSVGGAVPPSPSSLQAPWCSGPSHSSKVGWGGAPSSLPLVRIPRPSRPPEVSCVFGASCWLRVFELGFFVSAPASPASGSQEELAPGAICTTYVSLIIYFLGFVTILLVRFTY